MVHRPIRNLILALALAGGAVGPRAQGPAPGTGADPPAAPAFDAADYYPLAMGNTWIWSGRGPGDIRVRTVVGSVATPLGIRWEVETRSADGGLRSRDLVLQKDGRILRQATLLPDGGRIDYEPPILYAPFSAVAGTKDETDMQELPRGEPPRKYRRVTAIERVGETSSGLASFPEAIQVSFARFPDADFPMPERVLTVWFARGFGPVSLHVKNLAGTAGEEVLYARIGDLEFGVDPRTAPAPVPAD